MQSIIVSSQCLEHNSITGEYSRYTRRERGKHVETLIAFHLEVHSVCDQLLPNLLLHLLLFLPASLPVRCYAKAKPYCLGSYPNTPSVRLPGCV